MTHYHLIGIGGTGLSAIARVLIELGHQVSGSDMVLSPTAQELSKMGATVYVGHDANQVIGADVIIRSSAIPDSNVEVIAGLNTHVPVVKRMDFLNELTASKKVIAVAGTHGKTTTTAMCAWVFHHLGLDPSYIIGGVSKNLGTNAHAGEGDFFIIEADEYDRMFLGLEPETLILTIVEYDHPDYFPTESAYFQAFQELTQQVKPAGRVIACKDDPGAMMVLNKTRLNLKKITYGTRANSDYRISGMNSIPHKGIRFSLVNQNPGLEESSQGQIELAIPGRHNALNAAAVVAVCREHGISFDDIKVALEKYSGTGRRFDILGTANEVTIIDDYAHHPTEIRATLSAARCRYPECTIWTVWQPHTYSRTKELIEAFKDAFKESDHVIVSGIYASREKKQDYSSEGIVGKMHHPDARQISELGDIASYLTDHLKPGDVLLVLSAGDANWVSREVFENLKARETSRT